MSNFEALHSRANDARASACAFDLLMRDGEDLRKKPYSERKAMLLKTLRRSRAGIQYGFFVFNAVLGESIGGPLAGVIVASDRCDPVLLQCRAKVIDHHLGCNQQ